MYSEKTNEVAMTNNDIKTFMNDLWGAEGDFIDTPLGRGRIENVRTKAGIDLEVRVDFGGRDVGTRSGMRVFSGLELFEFDA
jgi:hypothetical protein|tara:strand:+ start:115 stop:360 length:246 start_codon:yes stop_codon:yes gene_type:complete